jgi:hypothetical protein
MAMDLKSLGACGSFLLSKNFSIQSLRPNDSRNNVKYCVGFLMGIWNSLSWQIATQQLEAA